MRISDWSSDVCSSDLPQIAKGYGDAPVQAYIAAMPGWKSAAWARLDRLIDKVVPGVAKAVKWNSPFYGAAGQGEASAHWILSIHCFAKSIKVAFLRCPSLDTVPPVSPKRGHTHFFHITEEETFHEA